MNLVDVVRTIYFNREKIINSRRYAYSIIDVLRTAEKYEMFYFIIDYVSYKKLTVHLDKLIAQRKFSKIVLNTNALRELVRLEESGGKLVIRIGDSRSEVSPRDIAWLSQIPLYPHDKVLLVDWLVKQLGVRDYERADVLWDKAEKKPVLVVTGSPIRRIVVNTENLSMSMVEMISRAYWGTLVRFNITAPLHMVEDMLNTARRIAAGFLRAGADISETSGGEVEVRMDKDTVSLWVKSLIRGAMRRRYEFFIRMKKDKSILSIAPVSGTGFAGLTNLLLLRDDARRYGVDVKLEVIGEYGSVVMRARDYRALEKMIPGIVNILSRVVVVRGRSVQSKLKEIRKILHSGKYPAFRSLKDDLADLLTIYVEAVLSKDKLVVKYAEKVLEPLIMEYMSLGDINEYIESLRKARGDKRKIMVVEELRKKYMKYHGLIRDKERKAEATTT